MMGMLPSPSQVARSHTALYEAFYRQVDPAETDRVSAVEAAAFLKRSGLPDTILSKIWDMSDPQGKGFLDKQGFYVALKLIALHQNGKDLTLANMNLDLPPPQLQTPSGRNSPAVDWNIKAVERKKYEEMFYSMGPVAGKLPGDKVKPVMLNSKLPLDILGKIWDLSDTDQDGFLSKEEFILAMHLVYKALENIPVPSVLPPELISILKRKHSIPGMVQVLPDVLPQGIDNMMTGRIRRSSTPSSDIISRGSPWIVNAVDKAKFDEMFHTLDTDKDGFVTGLDVKDTFLKSGLPQTVLAHIWNLCDIKQNGKLNSEQFALAMYLVQQKIQGIEVPATLYSEMIPPTLRPKPSSDISQDVPLPITSDLDSSGSKELDMISSEIKELQMEKMTLEKDLAQKEADVKIKNGELKNLQNELDALETMLKQLEIQKGEARKRLNDLDKQKNSLDLTLCDLLAQTEDDVNQIDAMKKQKEEQELELEVQEKELNEKRKELNELRQEETKLESQISSGKIQLDALTSSLQSTILQISQMKIKIDQLQEQHRLMSEAIKDMDNAISFGDFRNVSEFTLTGFAPLQDEDFTVASPTFPPPEEKTMEPVAPISDFQEDPFGSKDPFEGKINGFSSDPFAGEDPFKGDPFKDTSVSSSGDPFGSVDPFESVFNVTAAQTTKDDPFLGNDPFGGFPAPSNPDKDPFDPFGLSKSNSIQSPVGGFDADPFGADPFGASPAAPPRPESPTPALPPKKSKAPPPRPAPPSKAKGPSPKPGPTRAAPAPPVPPPPAVDPFKAEFENTSNNTAFPDLFSKTAKTQDAFDPFSNPAAPADNFANFDNFADFDNIK
ncbi:epidermal growth factor receptor substrate 15-like 1 [Trichonephila inaurata madagascariensis]|uniref:Epidermal growth factor receptor substrate 15-like 1 n=1 Tax=Trichonephila inaurata madagascariensis TaxID=2747483 RepID=A0A8X6XK40_9ARAC|nr:epidermal growth factor receptor substrate 15-like 1 [Trichonephila inaurata madagascariensis]